MPTTTFEVAASLDDQSVDKTLTSYPPSGTLNRNTSSDNYTSRSRYSSNYEVACALLKWNTVSLPDDCLIESATLKVRPTYVDDADARSLRGEWYEWSGVLSSDYAETAAGGAFANVPVANFATTADETIPITDLSGISKTRPTFMRLHISGGQPNGGNFLQFASYSHTTLPAARLVVTYSVSAPTSAGNKVLLGAVGV